jgi:predicted transcriptional regulator
MVDDPYLPPTKEEAATLRLHLADWDGLDAWPKSVSVAILRGHDTVDGIAEELGVSREQAQHALGQLTSRGLLYEGSLRRYLLR